MIQVYRTHLIEGLQGGVGTRAIQRSSEREQPEVTIDLLGHRLFSPLNDPEVTMPPLIHCRGLPPRVADAERCRCPLSSVPAAGRGRCPG